MRLEHSRKARLGGMAGIARRSPAPHCVNQDGSRGGRFKSWSRNVGSHLLSFLNSGSTLIASDSQVSRG
jgi:hypothetical protein